ncbi:MAG: 30S ribosomal protein S8e [Methanosarcinales archaeon]
MKWQGRSRRKYTGGRIVRARGKRKSEFGREESETHLNETRRKNIDTYGGNRKVRLLRCNKANVTNTVSGTTKQVTIETVEDNPANKHYVRRNILTKGTIIKTELGTARITNRPGQDGVVNAVLLT